MKKHLFAFVILFISLVSYSQDNPDRDLSTDQLKEDLSILKKNLEVLHSDLYERCTKEEFDSLFDVVDRQLNEAMTPMEFYKLLLPIQDLISNGHTYFFPNGYYFSPFYQAKVLPIRVKIIDYKIYVHEVYTDSFSLKPGYQIKKINNIEAREIIDRLSFYFAHDGENTSLPIKDAEENFPFVLMHELGKQDSLHIEYADLKSKLNIEYIKTKTEEDIDKYIALNFPVVPESPINLDFKEKTAILTINTFDKDEIKKNGGAYNKQFEQIFKKIRTKECDNLILDLRDNSGGYNEVAQDLFRYFADSSVAYYKDTYTNNFSFKDADKKHIVDNLLQARILRALLLEEKEDKLVPNKLSKRVDFFQLNRIELSDYRFRGKVFVLTSPNTFSAGAEFAGMLKQHCNATIIGEETGGNPKYVVAGFMPKLILPNTGTTVALCMVTSITNIHDEVEDRGLVPDHEVKATIEQILNKEDVVMDYAFKLIGG